MNPRNLAAAVMLALLPLVACQSDGEPVHNPARAMSRLPESTRVASDAYISAVSDLTKQLMSVTDTASAKAAMQGIERSIARVCQGSKQLRDTSPQARADISEAFGERIRNVNSDYAAQVDRIKGTPGIGSILGPLLDKVRIYR